MRATNSSSVTRSSSSNLSCRKLNKKRKIPNISHIPILDLTSDEDLRDQQIHQQLISDYLDHGDQTFVCTICHAQLWTHEALKGNTSGKKTSYSMCCGNGKVELPELKEAPTNYQNLFHLKLRLIGRRKQDGRTYNLPTASEVAALIVGDIGDAIDNRDIIVTTKSGSLQRINELHPAYLGLQYPLLFPYGDDGYRVDIPHRDVDHSTNTKRRFCTMREFFAYRIQDRVNVFSLILNSRRLFQQFLVDAYTMIETERLYYIRNQQKVLICESYETLKSVQSHVVYTVEFQKRGLPHAHICLFMHFDYKLPTVEHIDRVISAEIPNKDDDPELYSLVSEFMMHGPCGSDNPKCPCMSENKCSKNFPKPFLENTSVDSNGYPIYRRRNDGYFIEKSGVKLDNRSVVPYHKTLLKRYQAHINVEWCNQAASIKYLFKYINKGPDRATVEVSQNNNGGDNDDAPVDEINDYYDCRFIPLNDDQLKNLTLYEIEKILLQNSSSLKDFVGKPYPDHDSVSSSNNRLITEELDFDMNNLQKESHQLLDSLTIEQRSIFDEIMTAVKHKKGVCIYARTPWKSSFEAFRLHLVKGEIPPLSL
ncbi:unnamed protein product [Lactuca virosa]|uniref:Helitron helicase-like domain-containing protein n=1 Tax=Lactuca virosa TaxID=75947 RepID=A0AAU9LNW4_9ASTR|nr:unnamed protein product [Lactuca virosa]